MQITIDTTAATVVELRSLAALLETRACELTSRAVDSIDQLYRDEPPDPRVVFGKPPPVDNAHVAPGAEQFEPRGNSLISPDYAAAALANELGAPSLVPNPINPAPITAKPKRKRRTKAELKAAQASTIAAAPAGAAAALVPTVPAVPPPPVAVVPPPPAVTAPVGDFRALMAKIVRSKLPRDVIAHIITTAGAPDVQTLQAMPHLYAVVDAAVTAATPPA